MQAKVVRLYAYDGLKRVEVKDAGPGEIVCIAGAEEIGIGDTIADPANPIALPRISVEEPTMSMVFKVNDGPFAGKEGKYVTSRNIRERLYREAYRNVSIRVEDTETPDAFKVVGRGELQLAVIVENMRREGYELTVSNPEPVLKTIDGEVHEPMELLVCDLPDDGVGGVTAEHGRRARAGWWTCSRSAPAARGSSSASRRAASSASAASSSPSPAARASCPRSSTGTSRGRAASRSAQTGAIVVGPRWATWSPTPASTRQERGALFVKPGDQVYAGMIVGEHSHDDDLDFNICKEKKLTNIRAAGPRRERHPHAAARHELEKALEWIAEDELVEVTPQSHPPAEEVPRPDAPLQARARPEEGRGVGVGASQA